MRADVLDINKIKVDWLTIAKRAGKTGNRHRECGTQ